jgi:D-sedoheptulose 7-phosphate isomerase
VVSDKPGIDTALAENEARRQLEAGIIIKQRLLADPSMLVKIALVMTQAFQRGNKVLVFGNGGSAADALHIVGELTGRIYTDHPPLPALALSSNTAVITAAANDFGYETVFTRQIQALAKPGDVVVGISTSGRSRNVIEGIMAAKKSGAVTVGFTGRGRTFPKLVEYALVIPSTDTPRIQEGYMAAAHIICSLVEQAIFGPAGTAGK